MSFQSQTRSNVVLKEPVLFIRYILLLNSCEELAHYIITTEFVIQFIISSFIILLFFSICL